MRRRLASATNPVHRHSVLQVLVDGALVALAYYLAYVLRFDGKKWNVISRRFRYYL
jgi:hypothetical protein